jgi:ribonuclease BN (tRNA processing enzyme)
LESIFLTHLHVDHTGDLAGMLLYPWGGRVGANGPLPPVRVYGPSRPEPWPTGDATFHRETTIAPDLPFPGAADLVDKVMAAHAYHLNVMPLDCHMPDPGGLARGIDIALPTPVADIPQDPIVVVDDGHVRISAVAVTHGRATPALAYRFDTPDGAVVFSGDTTVNQDLIALAREADVLVHQVADLDHLKREGLSGQALERAAALHTDVAEVGGVAERARVGELILNHYLPAEPDVISEVQWQTRAAQGFNGRTTAGTDGLRRLLSRVNS